MANVLARRKRTQKDSGKGVAGKDVSGGVAAAKNSNNSSTKDGEGK